MCLACEMDAWWFGEMEAATGSAGLSPATAPEPGTAGVPPALADFFASTAAVSEDAVEAAAIPGEVGETPAPQQAPVIRGFVCEEMPSE